MNNSTTAGQLPLYTINYRTLSYASGLLFFVEDVHKVGYDGSVELRGPKMEKNISD